MLSRARSLTRRGLSSGPQLGAVAISLGVGIGLLGTAGNGAAVLFACVAVVAVATALLQQTLP